MVHVSMCILFSMYISIHREVHGRHDVWVIRVYAQCLTFLRLSLWSEDQIEIES